MPLKGLIFNRLGISLHIGMLAVHWWKQEVGEYSTRTVVLLAGMIFPITSVKLKPKNYETHFHDTFTCFGFYILFL
jgi:hypothetical protein